MARSFIDQNHGWAVGDNDPYVESILYTSDGGTTWIPQDSGITQHLTDVHFTNTNNGWITSLFGTLLHTTDGGNNWIVENPGTTHSLSSIHFIDSQNGWISAGNNTNATILHTNNGGVNWTVLNNPGTSNLLYSIYLTDASHGWAVGYYGDIVSTISTNNTPPNQPIDPIPFDGEIMVNMNPTLSVLVSDPNSDIMTVEFYDASDDSLIGTDMFVESGERAYIIWNGLLSYTNYSWYAIVSDGVDTSTSATWSFETWDEADDDTMLSILSSGWNMISIPYCQSFDKSGILVSNDNDTYTWSEAVTLGIVDNNIFGWDATNQTYLISDIMDPYLGYWLYAYESCILL